MLKKRKISLRRETYEELSEIADQEGCSVSEMGEQIISDYIQACQEENGEDDSEDEEEPDDVYCSACGEPVPEDADECPACGEENEKE
jgi:DNA phosphorothioation-dependent restriction protein DptG